LDHHVIRRVERLAVELVNQHRDVAVVLRPRQPPRIVLAGNQPALAVARESVRVVRWLPKDAGSPRRFVPAQNAIVGDVAPKQATRITKPGRPFAPTRTGIEALDARVTDAVTREGRIEVLHAWIRITRAFLPGRESAPRQRGRCGTPRAGKHGASADVHYLFLPSLERLRARPQPPSAPCVLT